MNNQVLINGFLIALTIVVLVLLVVGLIFFWRANPNVQRGRVATRLKTFARLHGYKVLSNVAIPDGQGGVIKADLALVGYFGVLFLTVLSDPGDYYGEEGADRWLRVYRGARNHFPNPLQQGQAIMDASRKLFAANNVYNVGMDHWVVFTPSFAKHELAVKESLQAIQARRLGQLLDRPIFEKDTGIDLDAVARLLESNS